MAFTTHLQQVLAYLKGGHPILPTAGLPPTINGPTASPVVPVTTQPGAPVAPPVPLKGGM